MKIIISPAKKMNVETDIFSWKNLPEFLSETEILAEYLRSLDYGKLKEIWKCNDKIAEMNFNRLNNMNLRKNLSPAILSYEGIQYQYMSPKVMSDSELSYIENHLRILSGFYGVLRPFDGVVPYRLEMQSKLCDFSVESLYDFWKDKIFNSISRQNDCILNLASKEYSKCITRYSRDFKVVTCVFGEMIGGKVKEKGTFAKMARGEMVRFMASRQADKAETAKEFNESGYRFREELSSEEEYIFTR